MLIFNNKKKIIDVKGWLQSGPASFVNLFTHSTPLDVNLQIRVRILERDKNSVSRRK